MTSISVGGTAAVKKGLEEQSLRWANAHKAALLQMGIEIIRDAQAGVPVNTGSLFAAASVRVETNRKGIISARIGYRARHAGAIHKGSRTTSTGKKVVFRYKNGRAHFFARAVQKRLAGYASAIAAKTQRAHAEGLTPERVYNPYPYRPAARRPRKAGPITYEQHLKREAAKAKRARKRTERLG